MKNLIVAVAILAVASIAANGAPLQNKTPQAHAKPPAKTTAKNETAAANTTTPPGVLSEDYASGPYIVFANSQQAFRVYVDPKKKKEVRFVGHFAVTEGDNKDLQLYLLNEADYLRWLGDNKVEVAQPAGSPPKPAPAPKPEDTVPKSPLYVSAKESSGDIDLPIPDSGTFYLIISNRFPQSTQKKFNLDLKLQYKAVQ